MGPLILPSLPTTTFLFFDVMMLLPKAEVYKTTSNGESDSPGFPPIVPLIPDMLLINATGEFLGSQIYKKKMVSSIKLGISVIKPSILLIDIFLCQLSA